MSVLFLTLTLTPACTPSLTVLPQTGTKAVPDTSCLDVFALKLAL